jgi:hypothetical protein
MDVTSSHSAAVKFDSQATDLDGSEVDARIDESLPDDRGGPVQIGVKSGYFSVEVGESDTFSAVGAAVGMSDQVDLTDPIDRVGGHYLVDHNRARLSPNERGRTAGHAHPKGATR